LRDIGGIIVIDFIDMASPKNRAAVEKALGEELERDRTKTYVVEISPLGLVEMTRQNVTDGPREVMTKKCPTCGGDGIVVSEYTAAIDVERRLRNLVTPGSRAKAFKVEVAASIAWLVAGPGGTRLREIEDTAKRRFFLVGKEGEHLDHFKVLDQGTLEKVAPKLPVDVGQEVDVKLVEIGLHDPHAGVGKVEDVDIVVGDAAKLVGKKVTARITALTDGLAWAELISPVEAPDEPLSAEAEAEKPTRARRATAKKAPEADVAETEEVDDLDEVEEEDETDAVGEDGETPAVKKKTRRGSRGGRNRKKRPVTPAAAAENGTEPVSDSDETPDAEDEEEPAGPVIHVPDRELGTEENGDGPATPAKKRTRRGSRGGRNRKKKPVAVGAEANGTEPDELEDLEAAPELEAEPEPASEEPEIAAEPEPEAEPKPEPESAEDGDWGYTPMSEWGLDEK
jgi:ribonuclease G